MHDVLCAQGRVLLRCRNAVTIDGFGDVPENDEAALKQAVAAQPVSVAICASGGLQFYTSGVVGGKCCDELDHGVLAVGYGVVSTILTRALVLYTSSQASVYSASVQLPPYV